MKKILFALTVMGALVANADYLYWMVGSDATLDDKTMPTWTTASFFVDTSSTALSTATYDDLDLYGYAIASGAEEFSTAASYYIELYNGETAIGKSWFSGAQMAQYITGSGSIIPPGSHVLTGTAFISGVPEPTSGLLFLVGGMLLGLKRKRVA